MTVSIKAYLNTNIMKSFVKVDDFQKCGNDEVNKAVDNKEVVKDKDPEKSLSLVINIDKSKIVKEEV